MYMVLSRQSCYVYTAPGDAEVFMKFSGYKEKYLLFPLFFFIVCQSPKAKILPFRQSAKSKKFFFFSNLPNAKIQSQNHSFLLLPPKSILLLLLLPPKSTHKDKWKLIKDCLLFVNTSLVCKFDC